MVRDFELLEERRRFSRITDVEEGGVRLKLSVIETAGFGDQLDKDKRYASESVVVGS